MKLTVRTPALTGAQAQGGGAANAEVYNRRHEARCTTSSLNRRPARSSPAEQENNAFVSTFLPARTSSFVWKRSLCAYGSQGSTTSTTHTSGGRSLKRAVEAGRAVPDRRVFDILEFIGRRNRTNFSGRRLVASFLTICGIWTDLIWAADVTWRKSWSQPARMQLMLVS